MVFIDKSKTKYSTFMDDFDVRLELRKLSSGKEVSDEFVCRIKSQTADIMCVPSGEVPKEAVSLAVDEISELIDLYTNRRNNIMGCLDKSDLPEYCDLNQIYSRYSLECSHIIRELHNTKRILTTWQTLERKHRIKD